MEEIIHSDDRIVGIYDTGHAGALVIVIGAMHGNEPAGVIALKEAFRLLVSEPLVNPGFQFQGRLVGMIGHLRAYQQGVRFFEKDLNRLWMHEHVEQILDTPVEDLSADDLEVFELHRAIEEQINAVQPERVVILDLHTTSAEGGIFTIPTEGEDSLEFAKHLHAPVVLGLLEGVRGPLLQYVAAGHFYKKHTVAAAFEAGQHQDLNSVSRSVAAIVHCLRAAGCIRKDDVDSRHEVILKQNHSHLPRVTRLVYVHRIKPSDHFRMRPGYVNFQKIHKGEYLADNAHSQILSPTDGMILMPLYQPKGNDGFFIVEEV